MRLEDGGGPGLARQQDARCADAERKGDRVAEAVGEEDLGHGEAHVALGEPQQVARVGERACRPCRAADARCPSAARSSPRSTSRTPCRRGACRRERARQPAAASHSAAAARRHRTRRCGIAVGDDQGSQPRSLAGRRIEPVGESRIADGNRRPGIGEIELQQVRRRQRVDQQRHEARADRAEQRRRIGRRVVEEQQHAIAALQPERLQPGAECAPHRRQARHRCAGPPAR